MDSRPWPWAASRLTPSMGNAVNYWGWGGLLQDSFLDGREVREDEMLVCFQREHLTVSVGLGL